MQSIRYIYKMGHGPSSSHTMGPSKATTVMMERFPNADHFKVVLFGFSINIFLLDCIQINH